MANNIFPGWIHCQETVNDSSVRMVYQKLYSTLWGNAETHWGLDNEEDGAKQYLAHLRETSPEATVTTTCGLVVSIVHPWLAATPDGWVYDPTSTISFEGFVEFKNPSSYKEMTINEAITAKKCDCLTICNGMAQLKQAHNYHYQIQTAVLHRNEIVRLCISHNCQLPL